MSVIPPSCSIYELLDILIRTRNNYKSPEQSFYLMDIVNCEANEVSYFHMIGKFHVTRKLRAQMLSLYYSQNRLKSFLKYGEPFG